MSEMFLQLLIGNLLPILVFKVRNSQLLDFDLIAWPCSSL